MLDTQWPDTTASSCLAFQFHSRAVQSSLALASQGRPGWRARSRTQSVWPDRLATLASLLQSHT